MDSKKKAVILDAATLGGDIDLSPLYNSCDVTIYDMSAPQVVAARIADCDVVVLNKIKLNSDNLAAATNLKLICVAATGFDNIDTEYCIRNNIAVCNVAGYSAYSVAQVTAAMVLSMSVHLPEYREYVISGEYTKSGVQNCLEPAYHELYGNTWGIIGYGSIGKQIAAVASAFGCKVIVNKQTPVDGVECVSVDDLCRRADIITIHTPLNDGTRNLINADRISMMKDGVLLVNTARGAVTDEAAVTEAVLAGKLGAFGCDVYSVEPFPENHPFNKIKHLKNVYLTPHMALGAFESRARCMAEVAKNIEAFFAGEKRNRIV